MITLLLSLMAWIPAPAEGDAGESPTVDAPPPPRLEDLFVSGQDGYTAYRIPVLLAAGPGTLLAFCEGRKDSFEDHGNIDILLRRSEDGGRTWGDRRVIRDDGQDTAGNPCPVLDASTGAVWLLHCRNNRRVLVISSRDRGISWSAPVDITGEVSRPDWTWYATGPGHGIQLRGGRLLIPCDHKQASADPRDASFYHSHMILSDDHGASWKIGGVLGARTNECTAVELEDGSVCLNMRSYHKKARRAVARSTDGGASFTEVELDPALIEPTCEASLFRLSSRATGGRSRVLFSNPASTERKDLTVRLSYDECRTWPVSRLLQPGKSAYSDLAVAPDGAILCLFERGEKTPYERITLARFTLEWLTQGADRTP
jgi:sialidase-1